MPAFAPTPASCCPPVLPHHPALWRGSALARVSCPGVPSGFPILDEALPGAGWPAACLTEILPAHEGIGELRLLGPALAALSTLPAPSDHSPGRGRQLAWIAPPYLPYAPALAAAGIALPRVIVVRTQNTQEALWAAEQALRSQSCGAVLLWSDTRDHTALRRLQLAAENSRSLAFLFRPPAAGMSASPAALRLSLENTDGGLAVRILKRRGAPLDRALLIPAMTTAERNHPIRSHSHALDRPASTATAAGYLSPRHAHA